MKKKILLIFSSLFFTISSYSQFIIVKSTADSLREIGDVLGALVEFKKDYQKEPKNTFNTYNYACALSINREIDSAFKYLEIAIQLDSNMAINALTDPDFLQLRKTDKWTKKEEQFIAMIQKKQNFYYKDLSYAKRLWELNVLDQAYYYDISIASKWLGDSSPIVAALWELKNMINNKNLEDLESLIKVKGWPKNSEVGERAAGAAFLVIQHSTYEKQKEYLPIIEKLCKESEARWQSYALMYDRIQTSENKPQKYGSQINFNELTQQYELYQLLDASKVDEWRNEVGLGPLAEYVTRWDIKFDPKND